MDEKPEGKHDQPVRIAEDGSKHYTMKAGTGDYGVTGSEIGGATTGWVYLHDGKPRYDNALRQVLEESSDRAAGIVAGAFIDDHLSLAIKRRLVNDKEVLPRMMPDEGGGVLGDFRTKTNMAFLMGLLSESAHKELNLIAKIRNAFAHKLDVHRFSDQPVTDWCASLTKWEQGIVRIGSTPLVVQTGLTITGPLHVRADGVFVSDTPKPPDTKVCSRTRFMRSAKFYLAALTLLVNEARGPEFPKI